MTLVIDLAAMGPADATSLLDVIEKHANQCAGRLQDDVLYFSEGSAKQEMLGWAAGAQKVVDDVQRLRIEAKASKKKPA